MKKLCGLLLTGLILLYACQKEVSNENGDGLSSEGSLQSDVSGDCLPKEVAGTYEATVALVSTVNVIEVEVNVLKTGPYLIFTDTVNGYYFRGSGTFSATGLTTVTLNGTGKPLLDGIDNFTVRYGTSECIVPVPVLPAGGGGPAEFTFNGSPNACIDFDAKGDYVVAVPLTSANTVDIKVNVTAAGTYDITTAESNGMTFSGQGTLLEGAQTITLRGTGTPVTAGQSTIPVTASGGATTCGFTINVLAVPPVAKDYFPRTPGSNWSYEVNDNPDDSLINRSDPTGPTPINGNNFNIFQRKDPSVPDFVDLAGYRKAGNDYYIYTDLGYWLGFEDSQTAEFLFLKDNMPVGTTWTTTPYSGNRDGAPIKVRIKFIIVQKDVVANVTSSSSPNSVAYPNTIVIEEHYEIEQPNGTWQEDIRFYKHYYSLDVGLVLEEGYFTNAPSVVAYKEELRRYQIAP
ncbi:MAG: hypothetical protein EOP49_15630 [Sphingobacteriales bacterium]|nr:MAG: hypothetical protein EOP49_15630 [Sphingobacteriales bacterium]